MTNQDIANIGRVQSSQASPVRLVLDFFSSIWLGIFLLTVLFVYGSVGSAGMWVPGQYENAANQNVADLHNWVHDIYWMIPWTQLHIRQAPGLEMTEFEWFHWWPFNLLILILCINIVVSTIRRIPLNTLNLGVWLIHSGIIMLAVGSVMYFATKLEGDAPIIRRQVVITVPGHDPISMAAMPGNETRIETDRNEVYRVRIVNIDPDWEILSGEHEGKRTLAVFVAVQGPRSQFVRQVLSGFPQYTEDTVRTDDPTQPFARAINVHGTAILDDEIDIQLEYSPERYFYLMDSTALYVREKGQSEWNERPIRNLPRYNEYLTSSTEVFMPGPLEENFRPRPLELRVDAVSSHDPMADQPMYVTHYLRYASMRSERLPGGERIDPAIRVRLESDRGHVEHHELVAFDRSRNTAAEGRLKFVWVNSEADFHELVDARPAMLWVRVPDREIDITIPATGSGEFVPIEGSEYEVRIDSIEDGLQIGEASSVSVAVVTIRTPDRQFERWVFDNEAVRSRDLAVSTEGSGMHQQELELDTAIEMTYLPSRRPAPVNVIAGPEDEDLHLLLAITGREQELHRLVVGEPVNVQHNITLTVVRYAARTIERTRPFVVPLHQREAGDRQQRSMIRVHVPGAAEQSVWLPYHLYPFERPEQVMRRFPFVPTEVELADGRVIEILFSRERRPLPAPVVLQDFILTTHIGGFTGRSTSIRDWTSIVKFQQGDGWTEPMSISMNKPTQFGGFSYFQSQWDPPDEPRFDGDARSNGLNFTVLGVGNRNGVWTQLTGSIVAVIGMLYAFYMKPFLKRRRQLAVYGSLQRSDAPLTDHEPRKIAHGDRLQS